MRNTCHVVFRRWHTKGIDEVWISKVIHLKQKGFVGNDHDYDHMGDDNDDGGDLVVHNDPCRGGAELRSKIEIDR